MLFRSTSQQLAAPALSYRVGSDAWFPACVPHRTLHNSVGCDAAQASTEDVPQVVDRKVRYACPSESGLPSGLDRRNRLVRQMRAREDKRTLGACALFHACKTSHAYSDNGTGSAEPGVFHVVVQADELVLEIHLVQRSENPSL